MYSAGSAKHLSLSGRSGVSAGRIVWVSPRNPKVEHESEALSIGNSQLSSRTSYVIASGPAPCGIPESLLRSAKMAAGRSKLDASLIEAVRPFKNRLCRGCLITGKRDQPLGYLLGCRRG